jgi:DNA polymerase-3 subunit delta'
MHSESPSGVASHPLWPRVIGQMRVKRTLLSALRTDRLAHAYLFYGPEGVGKDALALELARLLQCERVGEGAAEACGECDSCLKALTMQHPDIQLVTALPTGKSEAGGDSPLAKLSADDLSVIQEEYRRKAENPYRRIDIPRALVIKITSIREVRREAALTSFGGKKRVFIISHAEDMEDAAANALLKTLEEPISDCLILMTTSNREALLPTIVSRCQQVRFDPLGEEEITASLIAREGVDQTHAALIGRLANGSYARALELLQTDVFEERTFAVEFIRDALSGNAARVIDDAERIASWKNRDQVERFLLTILLWFRDALVLSHGGSVINLDQQEDLKRYCARNPEADIPAAMAETERALSLLGRNAYIKLVMYTLATRLRRTRQAQR